MDFSKTKKHKGNGFNIENLSQLYIQDNYTIQEGGSRQKEKENIDSNNQSFLSPRFIAKNSAQETWIINTPQTIAQSQRSSDMFYRGNRNLNTSKKQKDTDLEAMVNQKLDFENSSNKEEELDSNWSETLKNTTDILKSDDGDDYNDDELEGKMSEFFKKLQNTKSGKFIERPSIVSNSLEMSNYSDNESDMEDDDDPWAEDIINLEKQKKIEKSQIPEIVENGKFEPLIDGIFTISIDYDNLDDTDIENIKKNYKKSKIIFPPKSNFKCFSDPRISQTVQEISSLIYPNNSEIEVLEECTEKWEDTINQ